jgi:hypothetical protein
MDKVNPNDAPMRRIKRQLEKDNQKYRDAGKKKFSETVRVCKTSFIYSGVILIFFIFRI